MPSLLSEMLIALPGVEPFDEFDTNGLLGTALFDAAGVCASVQVLGW